MKTKNSFKQTILFLAIGLTTVLATAQTIITIDNNPNSTTTYTTIQAAHDAATAGDIIYVQPSATSYGVVSINKAITIVGRSHSEPGKKSTMGTITLKSSNVTIKGISFDDLSVDPNGPIPYTDILVTDNYIRSVNAGNTASSSAPISIDGMTIRGNVIWNSSWVFYNSDNVLFSNNLFTNSQPFTFWRTNGVVIANNVFKVPYTGVSLTNYDTTQPAILFNNMFIFNYNSACQVYAQDGDFGLANNLTYNYGSGQVTFGARAPYATMSESNSLANTNPLFTNVDAAIANSFAGTSNYFPYTRLADDLTLQAGSPALTAGVGGVELGLYGNGFRYQTLGNPSGVPLMDITSYDVAVPKNGNINVTITAKAN